MMDINMMDITMNTAAIKEWRGETAPFYRQYFGRASPQPVYMMLTEYGEVFVEVDYNTSNFISHDIWMNRALRWEVPATVSGTALADFLLRDDIVDLLQRIHAGCVVKVNISTMEQSITLADDASDAADELRRLIRKDLWENSGAHAPIISPGELAGKYGQDFSTLWPDHFAVEDAARRLFNKAYASGFLLNANQALKFLLDKAHAQILECPEKLQKVHIDALFEHNLLGEDQYFQMLAKFGDSAEDDQCMNPVPVQLCAPGSIAQ